MDRNSCLNYFQAFPFWEHMTEEDQDFLLDNIRELHYPAGAAIQSEERQCLGTLFLHLMCRSMRKQTVICFCFRQFLFPG